MNHKTIPTTGKNIFFTFITVALSIFPGISNNQSSLSLLSLLVTLKIKAKFPLDLLKARDIYHPMRTIQFLYVGNMYEVIK